MTDRLRSRLRPALLILALVLALPAAAQDTDPPTIRVLEGGVELVGGELFARAVTLTLETTDASPPVSVTATVGGAAFTSGGTVSAEGLHPVAVTATDAVGNQASLSLSFTIDTTPPVFGSVLPPAGTVTAAAEVTLSGEVSGAATAVTVDGQAAALAGGQWSAGPFALAEGSRSFSLVATDAAGNSAQLAHPVIRDSAAPAVAISQPAAGALLGLASVDVAGTVSDPHLSAVTVNGIPAAVSGGSFVALGVPLAEGSNLLTAQAVDAAGNSATTGRSVTLDTQPPALAITDPAPGTVVPGATLAVSGTAADPSLDRVEVNGTAATIAGGAWSASVPLAEGPNTVTAVAFDALGHTGADSVSVVRDSQAPAIQITAPADGTWLSATAVDVSGTVEEEPGLSVTVNGTAALLSSGTFSATGVELLEGENRLIARVTDALGNQGAHTRWIYRDTMAPELVSADPAAGALAIAPETRFTATFSEDLAPPPAGAWRLETAVGATLPAESTAAFDTLSVQSTTALPSGEAVRLILTAALTDRAGNPLSNPQTLGYTVADVEPPAAPTLSSAPPSPVCAPAVTVAGTTEPEATVTVTGGAGSASIRAAGDGSFSLGVVLASERLNALEVTATDLDGNRSAAATLDVIHDCSAPEVLSAVQSGDAFTIDFSEPVAAASLGASVAAASVSGLITGTLTAAGGGWQAVFTADSPLPAEPVAFPYFQLFGGTVTQSFVAGRVLDAATGRPLAGAAVEVIVSDGVANPAPVPGQTTAGEGRFSIPLAPGTHRLLISRPGYTPALAVATAPAGVGVDVFDPRLTPAAPPVALDASGGEATFVGGATLSLAAGALAASVDAAVTTLPEQALPALLPYGWSPRGAAWVDIEGAALAVAGELSLPVDAVDGSTLTVARLDEGTLQWRVESLAPVISGEVTFTLPDAGYWAAVEADPAPTAPPAATIGSPLAAAAAPDPAAVLAASLAFDPATVLPAQASQVTVSYTLAAEVASGLPLTLAVQEELTLLDGSIRRGPPYQADVVVYRAPGAAGESRTRFSLTPSLEARGVPLEMGAEDVTVSAYGGETLQGGVLGPTGGAVTTPEGDRVDLGPGALAEPTPVGLVRRAQGALPLTLPAAASFLGALDLDLAGRTLAADATLTLELGAAPAAGNKGLLLTPADWGATPVWRPVAQLTATAGGWQTATIDPQDLAWPGVRQGGLYVFVRLEIAVGYLRGTVTGGTAMALPGAFVARADAAPPWAQVTAVDGGYVLPASVGSVSISAVDATTGDRGLAATAIPAEDARVDLDLQVLATGPVLVSSDPADGAVDVISGIEPALTFSEPVDLATLAVGVLLYDGPDALPVDFTASGAVVRVVPRATLRPGAAHQIRLNTALKDLQGRRLASPVTVSFTTVDSLANELLDPSRIHLFEPATFDAEGVGSARVLGRAGAVPADSLVFVENLTRLAATPSVTAATDGSFELWIDTGLSDRLLLHVVPPGANESVFELGPFLSADGRAARLAADGVEATAFTTLDDVTVTVEAGTFLAPTVVRVEPVPLSEATAPIPSDFAYEAAFRLSLEGGEAQRALGIELPTPAGVTTDDLLLAKIERILGEDFWMVQDLLRRDGARLTTEPPPSAGAPAVAPSAAGRAEAPPASASDGLRVLSPLGSSSAAAAAGGLQPFAAPAQMGDRQEYLPGSANPGLYVVMSHTGTLDFVGMPFFAGQTVYFQHLAIEGMAAAVNRSIERLLERDAILIPTRQGETFTLEGRDLDTGYRFFEGTFDPPTPGEIVLPPPDVYGDVAPPLPIGGSPLAFFTLTPGPIAGGGGLLPGLAWTFDGGQLTVTGQSSAARATAQVRLLGLDDAIDTAVDAETGGSFLLTAAAAAGRRYVLALGTEVTPTTPILLDFSEGLAAGHPGIAVRDSGGADAGAAVSYGTTAAQARVTPSGGWRAGETYTLSLGPALADPAGNAWGETLEIDFTVAASQVAGTLDLAEVRDVARLGSWLFVAAGPDGLAIVDAADPANLAHLVTDAVTGQPVTWPFPYSDPVTAVAVDPHARVLVAGGGIVGPGQVKIFDPLALDRAAVAAAASDPAVLYAAYRGSTLVSDRLGGGVGTSLPEGTPRRITILSDDEIDRWALDLDAPPAGVTLDPATPPPGAEPYTLTVSGGGGVAGLPVTLRNLDRGSLRRVDADGAGGWSIALSVSAGDRLELLRNRQTLAYLVTLGVGIEVVDVSAFYGETPEDPLEPGLLSDVVGVYTGTDDPELALCNQPVSGIGSALLDLGTLFDPADPHPLTLVGLVGFRGLALFESDPLDVGSVSFFNEVCLEIGGSAQVAGLAVAEDYPFDLDGDGRVSPTEIRDYVVVAHRTEGVLVFDATDRDDLQLVGWVRLPGQAGEVAVDRDGRRLWVSGYGGGLYAIDFDSAPSVALVDANGDGLDDRVIETIALEGNTNAPALLVPELGIAYAGGLDRGLTSIAVAAPRLAAVTPDGTRPVSRLAPLGVPTAEEGGEPLPAGFRLLASLPGSSGPEIRLDLTALGPGGLPADGAGDAAALPGLPVPQLTGADGITLRRLADQPWEEGYQVYLSDPVATVADLRAAAAYLRTADEDAACVRCDGTAEGFAAGTAEMLSGHEIAVSLPATLRQSLAGLYPAAVLESAGLRLAGVPWEVSPALRQEPPLSPSTGSGDVVPGTLLHSGEMTHAASDLAVRGRRLDVVFTRTYRSQTVGSGPLGPGWELGYRVRLRELPDGSVERRDGRGRMEVFTPRTGGGYSSPPGVFSELSKSSAGWVLLDPQRNLFRFDRWGRLISIADAVKESPETGNEIGFAYDLAGRLVAVTDDLGRAYSLAYDAAGRLASVADFTGRAVTYAYDAGGRLETVTSPPITVGESTFPSGLATTYAYEPVPTGDLASRLGGRDRLASITDAKSQKWIELTYSDADGDGRADEVIGQRWGGHPLAIAYDFTAKTATVTDRRDFVWAYQHDGDGHPTSVTDPQTAQWRTAYDAEGLPTLETRPLGSTVSYAYDLSGDRRSRGNLLSTTVTPDGRGVNGSSASLATSITYHSRTNLPIAITDSRNGVTAIDRSPAGLPTRITRAQGAPEESVTQIAYDDRGRPTRVVNPNGHVTDYAYVASGPSAGYLSRATVDPGGLGITARYETDELGRRTAVIDPRGVRHQTEYNELGWVTEQLAAVSGATDGSSAPALGYRTLFLYDASGNLVERRDPVGDGTSQAVTFSAYGELDELLGTVHTVQPGGQTVARSYEYDPTYRLTRLTDPAGAVTEWVRDGRGLPTQVTRAVGQLGEVTDSFVYELEGRPITRTDARGKPWTTGYDGYGRPAASADPLGNRLEASYGDDGLPIEVRRLDPTLGLRARSASTYDLLGRQVEAKGWLWTGSVPSAARELVTAFGYDPAGNLVSLTDPLSRVTTRAYDAAERLATLTDAAGNSTAFTYDAAGHPTRVVATEQSPTGPATVATDFGYDALGRTLWTEDALGNRAQTLYDARSNPILSIDPEGYVTSRAFDSLDRLVIETRPEGIAVTRGWDAASRLVSYTDAFGQVTAYAYDALGRQLAVTYPDATVESYAYDPAGNLTQITQATGSVVTLTYDDAGRRTARTVVPGAGVVGAVSESYTYDPLDRLTQAVSGLITVSRTYDSLFRLTSETVAGRTVSYSHDDAGSVTGMTYPSGHPIVHALDALGRPATIASGGQPAATYSYRGTSRIAGKSLAGGALTGSATFDPAGRPLERLQAASGGVEVFGERLSWSPRGLQTARARTDRNANGLAVAYDGAGRLTAAAELADPTASLPNNSTAVASALTLARDTYTFSHDPVDNLLVRAATHDGVAETVDLPPDASGRHRPAAVAGVPLSWDANGNLTGKGDLRFAYDERNRLTRVTDAGGAEIARYEYDAFNRKVNKVIGASIEQTAWAGWQAVEVYRDGALYQRRTWGLGLDEAVELETDLDGDGVLDVTHLPLYDTTGNLVLLTDTAGKPVERYEYTPFGPREIRVDNTPPAVVQVRVESGEMVLELDEPVLENELLDWHPQRLQLQIGDFFIDPATPGGGPLQSPGSAGAPSATSGVQAASGAAVSATTTYSLQAAALEPGHLGRRFVITLSDPPDAGEAVILTIEPEALTDAFLNRPAAALSMSFDWPAGDAVVDDSTPPEVRRVAVVDGVVEVELSEPVDPTTLAAGLTIDGQTVTWSECGDRYRVCADTALGTGVFQLTVRTGLTDLSGLALLAQLVVALDLTESLDRLAWEAVDPGVIGSTATGNVLGFHGLELDSASGLFCARNRWYDPEMGRFLTTDPLGYVDGPNLYQYGVNNPINFADPMGLCTGAACADLQAAWMEIHRRQQEAREQEILAWQRWEDQETLKGGLGLIQQIGREVSHYDLQNALLAHFKSRPRVSESDAYGLVVALTGPGEGVNDVLGELQGIGRWAEVLDAYLINYPLAITGGELTFGVRALASNARQVGWRTAVQQIRGVRPTSQPVPRATTGAIGAADELVTVGEFGLSRTVSAHVDDLVKRGHFRGEPARPYLESPHTIREIMRGGTPVPDPGGAAGALRWDVPGTFRGSQGTWELVVDPNNTILHLNFVR